MAVEIVAYVVKTLIKLPAEIVALATDIDVPVKLLVRTSESALTIARLATLLTVKDRNIGEESTPSLIVASLCMACRTPTQSPSFGSFTRDIVYYTKLH